MCTNIGDREGGNLEASQPHDLPPVTAALTKAEVGLGEREVK